MLLLLIERDDYIIANLTKQLHGRIPFDVSLAKEEYDLSKYFTKEELEKTAKELAYIKKHLDKYPSYNNKEDLKASLLSDD